MSVCAAILWPPAVAAQTDKSGGSSQNSPLSAAKAQLDAGDLAGADATLLSLLSSQPDNSEALLLLGIVRGRQERFAEAEVLFKRVLQSQPHSLIAQRNLAFALLSQNKLSEAADQYDLAIQLDPDPQLKVECAQVRARLGQFDVALKLLDSIPAGRLPRSALPVKAAAYLGLERRNEAEAQIPLVRGSSEATMELADVFLGANLPDDALKTLGPIAPDSKYAAHLYYLEGKALREKGQLHPALNDFRRSLSRDPKSLLTLVALAEIYSAQGQHSQAAQMLEKAHNLDPGAAPVLRHLAMENMQAGRSGAAVEAATALQAQSKDLDDQYLLATALLQDEQYDAASSVLKRYLDQRPSDSRAMLALGMAYIKQRSYPDARLVLERALQVQPDFPQAEYDLGLVAKEEGRAEDAIEYFQKSLAGKSDNAAAWFDLGSLYLERGELDKAENALRKSLALDANGIQTEYNLGLVLSKQGKADEAKQHMQRYQELLKNERTREEQERTKHPAD